MALVMKTGEIISSDPRSTPYEVTRMGYTPSGVLVVDSKRLTGTTPILFEEPVVCATFSVIEGSGE